MEFITSSQKSERYATHFTRVSIRLPTQRVQQDIMQIRGQCDKEYSHGPTAPPS